MSEELKPVDVIRLEDISEQLREAAAPMHPNYGELAHQDHILMREAATAIGEAITAWNARIAEVLDKLCSLSDGFKHLRDREDQNAKYKTDLQVIEAIFCAEKKCTAHVLRERDAYIKEAKARIAELEAAQGWRPIADAPKDGTFILGYCGGFPTPTVIRWHSNDEYEGWADEISAVFCSWPPSEWLFTHWMPLPTPPE